MIKHLRNLILRRHHVLEVSDLQWVTTAQCLDRFMKHPHLIIVNALQHLRSDDLKLLRYHMTLCKHHQFNEKVCVSLSEVIYFPLEIVVQGGRRPSPIIFPQATDKVLPERIILAKPIKGDLTHSDSSPGISQHTGEERQHGVRPNIHQRNTCII